MQAKDIVKRLKINLGFFHWVGKSGERFNGRLFSDSKEKIADSKSIYILNAVKLFANLFYLQKH